MHDTFMVANTLLFLCLWLLSLIIFYAIIKAAVRNGVRQANAEMVETIRDIERSVHEIKIAANKKEST